MGPQDPSSPSRILIVNGSTRSEHSCPGEISKTRRLAQAAQNTIASLPGYEVDFLDLSMLADWLTDIGMIQAGTSAALDTWIGWYRPYATSHEDLDADPDLFVQVRNAALSVAKMVLQIRSGAYQRPDRGLHNPREK